MALVPKVLKNFNLFVNNIGYAGRVEEIVLPKLSINTEEFSGGGMDAPVQLDMGLAKLECEMMLGEYDTSVIKLFGLRNAQTNAVYSFEGINAEYGKGRYKNCGNVPLTLRGALQDEEKQSVIPIKINLVGAITELDFGQWKAGEKAGLKLGVALRYYQLIINNEVLVEVDVNNMTRVVNGVDQMNVISGKSFWNH